MTVYRITMFDDIEVVMLKTTEQMKEWIKKYNVTDPRGNKVDLRKARGGMNLRVNGKLLRVHEK